MNKLLTTVLATLTLLFCATLTAHSHGGGHGPVIPVSEGEAVEIATSIVGEIVQAGSIDTSWGKIKSSKIIKKKFSEQEEWVVSFNNPQAAEGKKILYVFLSIDGQYLGANYSGE